MVGGRGADDEEAGEGAEGGKDQPVRREPEDRELALTRRQILVVGGGSLMAGPLLLLAIGLLVRWRRRVGWKGNYPR